MAKFKNRLFVGQPLDLSYNKKAEETPVEELNDKNYSLAATVRHPELDQPLDLSCKRQVEERSAEKSQDEDFCALALTVSYLYSQISVDSNLQQCSPPTSQGSSYEQEDFAVPTSLSGFGSATSRNSVAMNKKLPAFKCDNCKKIYKTADGFARHQAEGCVFPCNVCSKVLTRVPLLNAHIKTHTLPHMCQICGKGFSRLWLLRGHILTHTGEKPYKCDQCHVAFADKSNLGKHKKTHKNFRRN